MNSLRKFAAVSGILQLYDLHFNYLAMCNVRSEKCNEMCPSAVSVLRGTTKDQEAISYWLKYKNLHRFELCPLICNDTNVVGVSGFGFGIFHFDPVFYALIQNKCTSYSTVNGKFGTQLPPLILPYLTLPVAPCHALHSLSHNSN